MPRVETLNLTDVWNGCRARTLIIEARQDSLRGLGLVHLDKMERQVLQLDRAFDLR